jgi:hypothetical protein
MLTEDEILLLKEALIHFHHEIVVPKLATIDELSPIVQRAYKSSKSLIEDLKYMYSNI